MGKLIQISSEIGPSAINQQKNDFNMMFSITMLNVRCFPLTELTLKCFTCILQSEISQRY